MEIYCVKCKRTPARDETITTMKNYRLATSCTCEICGIKMFRFLKMVKEIATNLAEELRSGKQSYLFIINPEEVTLIKETSKQVKKKGITLTQ